MVPTSRAVTRESALAMNVGSTAPVGESLTTFLRALPLTVQNCPTAYSALLSGDSWTSAMGWSNTGRKLMSSWPVLMSQAAMYFCATGVVALAFRMLVNVPASTSRLPIVAMSDTSLLSTGWGICPHRLGHELGVTRHRLQRRCGGFRRVDGRHPGQEQDKRGKDGDRARALRRAGAHWLLPTWSAIVALLHLCKSWRFRQVREGTSARSLRIVTRMDYSVR